MALGDPSENTTTIESSDQTFTPDMNGDEEGSQSQLHPVVADVKNKYWRAKESRRSDETRWSKAYYNFRGIYGKEVKFTSAEKSRVFVKVTKTKVLAAYGQLIDVLFSKNGGIPLNIEPTKMPEGVEESVHVSLKDPKGDQSPDETLPSPGYDGDAQGLQPGTTMDDLDLNAGLEEMLEGANVQEGEGTSQHDVTFYPAERSAKKMQKRIQDQLEESGAAKHLRHVCFEQVLLGTGILKGPFVYNKEYPNWDEQGNYDPITRDVPRVEAVSVWNFYPDPDAISMDDAEFVIERHKMSKTQLRNLRWRPYFFRDAIRNCIDEGPGYEPEWWEHNIDDSDHESDVQRWEVLEYWGVMDAEMIKDELGDIVTIPDGLEGFDEFQVNAWICNDRIIRFVLNPFKPRRIPYHAVPYELNPYNFFGVGLAENMEDAQTLMNGFTRMAVDNAVLSGNIMIEVDETNLAPGQDMEAYPGKVWRKQAGAPGQAIFATKWPNTTQENMLMYDKFRQLADDETGIPSYAHGGTQASSTTRTASGMSMMMNAASLNIKTVVKNIDDYLLRPLGESLFAFNMQFNFDPEIKGDLEIKARGTSSLMLKEVKSQRLMTFLQVAANPALAPFIKFPTILREIAESMDIDPDKVTNSPKEAQLQALLLGKANAAQMQGQGAPAGANPADSTGRGGGNIGTGSPAMPGMEEFSSSGGGGQSPSPSGMGGGSGPEKPEGGSSLSPRAGA